MGPWDYIVQCWHCLAEYDAASAMWCSCSPSAPTKMCPFCLACFCDAASDYAEAFWSEAPEKLAADRGALAERRGLLGSLLVAAHRITPDQLAGGLRHQARTGQKLGRCLLDLGFLSEDDLNETLGDHRAPVAFDLDGSVADDALAQAVGMEYCVAHRLVPVEQLDLNGQSLVLLAMADPSDAAAIDHVQSILCSRVISGRVDEARIMETLQSLFPQAARRLDAGGQTAAADALGAWLLTDAVESRASHLQLVARGNNVRLSWAVDGVLHPVSRAGQPVGRAHLDALLAWFGDNPDKRGRHLVVGARELLAVLHLKTDPSETVATVRLFDRREVEGTLEFLALTPAARLLLDRKLSRTDGLVLLAGPAAAETERTFWALVNRMAARDRQVMLLSAPLHPAAVNVRTGKTVPSGPLHEAPAPLPDDEPHADVLALYQPGDPLDLCRAIDEARQSLVLLRVTDQHAGSALQQLVDAGVSRTALAEVLCLIIDQRAVRRICERCFEADPEGQNALPAAGFTAAECRGIDAYRGAGCAACGVGGGYRGREPLLDLLPGGDELKRLVRSGEFGALGGLQRPATILPPRAQALELVARGVTTVDEVRRVLVDQTPAGAVATDWFSAGRSHPLRSAG